MVCGEQCVVWTSLMLLSYNICHVAGFVGGTTDE